MGVYLPACEESINDRFKIRFYLSNGSESPLSYGYTIKFILIDKQNLLLYSNILELSYSSVKRAVKEKVVHSSTNVRRKKGATSGTVLNEAAVRVLSRNFVDESSKIIGEENRLLVKRAMKRLRLKMDELFRSIKNI